MSFFFGCLAVSLAISLASVYAAFQSWIRLLVCFVGVRCPRVCERKRNLNPNTIRNNDSHARSAHHGATNNGHLISPNNHCKNLSSLPLTLSLFSSLSLSRSSEKGVTRVDNDRELISNNPVVIFCSNSNIFLPYIIRQKTFD